MNHFRTRLTGRALAHWLRLALLALLVIGVSPLPGLTPDFASVSIQTVDAKDKTKKKDRSRTQAKAAKAPPKCQFTKTATLWTLKKDCTTAETIVLPTGVSLNGAGKTITMSGPVNGFARRVQVTGFGQGVPQFVRVAAAVLANGGRVNVENLTIRGDHLDARQGCPAFPEGLAFINASGAIRGVTVEDIRAADCGFAGFSPGVGISATGASGQTIDMSDIAVRRVGSTGIQVSNVPSTAGISVDIDGATVDDAAGTGVILPSGSLANATISSGGDGSSTALLVGEVGRSVSLDDVAVSGAFATGMYGQGGDIDVDGFEFTAETPGATGIFFDFDTGLSATVANSTIEDAAFAIAQCVGAVAVSNSTITGSQFGTYAVDCYGAPVTATISDTTIDRGAPTADAAFGVVFDAGSQGETSGNTISNFADDNPDATSCGIALFPGSGEVSGLNSNDFSGNEQDICDFREAALNARARAATSGAPDLSVLDDVRERVEEASAAAAHESRDKPAKAKAKAKGGHGKHRGKHGRR